MLETINTFDNNIIGFRLDGGIDKDEMARWYDQHEVRIASGEKLMLYAEIKNMSLGDVSWEAIKEEMRRLKKYPMFIANISKAVLVTDIEWLKKEFAVECALIPTLEGKSFSFGEENAAIEWLRTDQRAGKRLDVTMSELTRFGTVKTIGGFALGMLASNLLTRNQRRNVGLATLAGGILIGLPIALKIINNNREFFNCETAETPDQTAELAA